MINYKEIEAKWQKAWADARIFEGEPNGKESYMVTAAWPYVNTPLHIGHLRAFGTADALARYKRMRGFNVLYPMGFHATGTPVLAFAKRIKNGDQDIVEELKVFHVPESEIKKMTDPAYIANYFIKESGELYRRAGFSIDMRRSFTSIDPLFSKYVEWQFGILNSQGKLTKGKHAIGWCPNENNAVGQHDTKHDVQPEIEKLTVLKFKVDGEDAYMICGTYRPETIFGVTNLFIKENGAYVICTLDDDKTKYYIGKGSVEKLKYQKKIQIVGEADAKKMLEKKCINPVTNEKIPVLPGFFVKEDFGTGIVMSVPAHAPFDYAALERLKNSGYPVPEMKYTKVLDVEVGRSLSDVSAGEAKPIHLDIPALAYLEVLHTDPNAMDDMLEFATKLEYREESHWGKMIIKGYEGMSEPEAREKIKEELEKKGNAILMYVLQNAPVYCRCGYEVVVKIVEDQWFINYGDKEWKEQVKQNLQSMNLLPEKTRNAFDYTVDWIDVRAVSRRQGLGTKFPFDKETVIESLSDSTIYMAFYTIANFVKDLQPDQLKPEFFDYVFNAKGNTEGVAKNTGIQFEIIKKCRESFEYWYRLTSRHSGPDLIYNHLTMYIFNHVAIFDKKYWPKQIVTNGFVMCEGEKMSKSLGNIVPLSDAIEKYGTDPTRLNVIAGGDLSSDSEFSDQAIKGIQERLDYLYNSIEEMDKLSSGELKKIDLWLYSKLSGKVEAVTAAMEKMEMRAAYTQILYDSILELKKYFARGGNNSITVKDFISAVVLMLQPVAPHVAEEMWSMLGNDTFASVERWPGGNKELQNPQVEIGEELIEATIADAIQARELIQKKSGKQANEIKVIVAEDWKRKLINMLAKEKNPGKVLESIKDDKAIDREAAAKMIGGLAKRVNELRESTLSQKDEFETLNEARDYISKQLNAKLVVEMEAKSKSQRAGRAMPEKPSLDILSS